MVHPFVWKYKAQGIKWKISQETRLTLLEDKCGYLLVFYLSNKLYYREETEQFVV